MSSKETKVVSTPARPAPKPTNDGVRHIGNEGATKSFGVRPVTTGGGGGKKG